MLILTRKVVQWSLCIYGGLQKIKPISKLIFFLSLQSSVSVKRHVKNKVVSIIRLQCLSYKVGIRAPFGTAKISWIFTVFSITKFTCGCWLLGGVSFFGCLCAEPESEGESGVCHCLHQTSIRLFHEYWRTRCPCWWWSWQYCNDDEEDGEDDDKDNVAVFVTLQIKPMSVSHQTLPRLEKR